MGVAANKRSIMTLFSGESDVCSHQIRFMLAEKGVACEFEFITPETISHDLLSLNPYGTIPTLVDRDLTLYYMHIMAEYIEERFPHPPLLPVYPHERANSRMILNRILQEWYPLLNKASSQTKEADKARKQLKEEILSLAPIFKNTPFFMSEEFTLVDCALGPLLWRLKTIDIDINQTQAVKDIRPYMKRIFNRNGFMISLTQVEREMRVTY